MRTPVDGGGIPAAPGRTESDSDWPTIRRLLGLTWDYKGRCLLVVGTQILLLGLALLGLRLTGAGVDAIRNRADLSKVSPLPGWRPSAEWTPMELLAVIAACILAVSLLRMAVTYANTVTAARLVQDIVIRLRSQVYDRLQRLGFRFFDTHETGTIITRVTRDVQAVRSFVDGVVIQGVVLVLTLAVSLAYMVHIHLWLTLACLGTTPLIWLMTVAYSRHVRPIILDVRALFDHMILVLSENVQAMPVVKGFGREPEEIRKFSKANRDVLDRQQAVFRASGLYSASVGMLAQINTVVLIGYGGYLTMTDRLALGSGLLVFYGLLSQFSGQVNAVAGIADSIQQSLAGAERFFQLYDTAPEILAPQTPARLPRSRGAVELRGVTFGYDPAKPVLREVSIAVEPGQCIAILGPTGSGKSTMLSLIPRFYDPTRGEVRIDGRNVRDYHLTDLRRNIGMVFQETFLFSNSVAANIAFGSPDATREQIVRAARIAAAHDFILEMEKGYDTVVGERGLGLSGGQRQRLSLARAVLLEPPMLLLDDPTAAIDPQTESEIQAAIDNVMQGRTTFIVSHRLSTLRRADRILVMENGCIVQAGTHEELIAAPGHYRDAAQIQFDYSKV